MNIRQMFSFHNKHCLHWITMLFVFLEIPVSILKKLEDIRCPEGSGVTLECELSRHNVDVKWTKVKLT